jgi:hypothetical protein
VGLQSKKLLLQNFRARYGGALGRLRQKDLEFQASLGKDSGLDKQFPTEHGPVSKKHANRAQYPW